MGSGEGTRLSPAHPQPLLLSLGRDKKWVLGGCYLGLGRLQVARDAPHRATGLPPRLRGCTAVAATSYRGRTAEVSDVPCGCPQRCFLQLGYLGKNKLAPGVAGRVRLPSRRPGPLCCAVPGQALSPRAGPPGAWSRWCVGLGCPSRPVPISPRPPPPPSSDPQG